MYVRVKGKKSNKTFTVCQKDLMVEKVTGYLYLLCKYYGDKEEEISNKGVFNNVLRYYCLGYFYFVSCFSYVVHSSRNY